MNVVLEHLHPTLTLTNAETGATIYEWKTQTLRSYVAMSTHHHFCRGATPL